MSQTVENLISKLRELELEEKTIKAIKNELMSKVKEIDNQLDQLSSRRSMALKELELVYSSDQSENEFQSLSSENSFYPKSSEIDSDEFTQKRKDRSDSTGSDFEIKKVKSTDRDLDKQLQSVEDVNALDQQMVNKCIDEMAFIVIKEINNSDHQLKDEFEKLCRDPEFESLVKDVGKTKSKEVSPSLTSLCRSYSTDGNFKENVPPSSRVRRTSSNRFRFDQQNSSSNKSNQNVISQPIILPSKLLKGKKLLSSKRLMKSGKNLSPKPWKPLPRILRRIFHFGRRRQLNVLSNKTNVTRKLFRSKVGVITSNSHLYIF